MLQPNLVNPPSRSSVPPAPARALDRHELHRAVAGDWAAERAAVASPRRALAMGLAVLATLPLVSLLLEQWPAAPREQVAAIASLPLMALLLVARGWRAMGGRS